MIPGIVAAQGRGGAGGIILDVPAGALLHADFLSGTYFYDGAQVPLADLITGATPGASGIPITDGNGELPKGGSSMIQAFGDNLANGITMYYEWETLGTGITGPMFALFDHADPGSADDDLYIEDFGSFLETYGPTGLAADTPETKVEPGLNSIAVTWGIDIGSDGFETAIALNGEPVTPDGLGEGSDQLGFNMSLLTPVGSIYFGAIDDFSWYTDNVNLRTITLFPPQDKNDLPSISSTGELP